MTPSVCPVSNPLEWPDALEQWRLDDCLMAEAFDSLIPTQRAAIKTGMALHCALHGEHCAHTQYRVHDKAKGFSYTQVQDPVAWTVLFITPSFAAGPRLVGAIMPAILAGVPLLAVACVGGPPSSSVCACLELMGVEHVFCVPQLPAAEQFLQIMLGTAGSMACALFFPPKKRRAAISQPQGGKMPQLPQGELEAVHQAAQAAGLRCWQEISPPRLALHSSMAQADKLIRWCHPDAQHIPVQSLWGQDMEADALFYTQDRQNQPEQHAEQTQCPNPAFAPLVLSAGLEGFWCYQELNPQYFLQKSLMACCIPDNFSKD